MPVVFWPMESTLDRGSMKSETIRGIGKEFKKTTK
jgi:hypothetical protein